MSLLLCNNCCVSKCEIYVPVYMCLYALHFELCYILITLYNTCSEYGIYSTRILAGPTCSIRRRNHQVKDIQVLGGDPRLKFLFSPGFEIDDEPEK